MGIHCEAGIITVPAEAAERLCRVRRDFGEFPA